MAEYRSRRRAEGKDCPRRPRVVNTDGHLPNRWFTETVIDPALAKADLPPDIRMHSLRHAHASWLLNGGADLTVVKERLGHASITTTERYSTPSITPMTPPSSPLRRSAEEKERHRLICPELGRTPKCRCC